MADYDLFAEKYKRVKETPFCIYSEEPTYLASIGELEGKSVLDLACGEGHYTRKIKARGAARVVGVDLSEGMIALARRQEGEEPLGIEYQVGDGARLGQVGTFDLVTASYLLNYAPDRAALVGMCRAAHQSLKGGGRFVTLIANGDMDHEHYRPESRRLAKYGYDMDVVAQSFPCKDGTPVTLHFYTDDPFSVTIYHHDGATYKGALEEAGFKDVRSKPFSVTQEGMDAMPAGFWDDFLEIVPLVCVEAGK